MTRPPPAPIRPLGVAEILDGAVRLVRGNARAVLSVSVPFAVGRAGLAAVLQYGAIDSPNAATLGVLGSLLLAGGLGIVLTGLLAPMFSAALLGSRLGAGESLRRVGRKTWGLVALGVVVTVAEGAGIAAFGVGGVWLWGVWAVAAPALVLERTGMRAALGRSVRLVRGMFWRTWGIRVLGWVLTTVLGLFVAVPFDALAAYITGSDLLATSGGIAHPGWYVVITAIGGVVSAALLGPISAAVDVLLYTDLRMRKEGMDIVLALPPAPEPTGTGRPAVSAW
jgi:hypothetical protein